MDKLIITAAVTGGVTTRNDNENLPITPKEIAQAVYDCWNAGASIAHIHARNITGEPSTNVDTYQEIVSRIREKCNILINLTTTGWKLPKGEENARWEHLKLRPDLATFTPGSMNRGESININSPDFLKKLATKIKEYNAKPEIEIFDYGMIIQTLNLARNGLISEPFLFQLVLGVNGGISASHKNLINLVENLPQNSTWFAAAIGKNQLPINLQGIMMGGHVRTGLEDNVYYRYKELALSNAQLVERLANYSYDFGRDIATPEEARRILGLNNNVLSSSA